MNQLRESGRKHTFVPRSFSTATNLQKQANKMAVSKDNLNWFLQLCTKIHYLLKTDVPMYDVALMIMKHIIRLNILFVSDKVIDDLQRTISAFTKSKSKHLMLYIEPIANRLMQLNGDDSVSVCNFKALREYIMANLGAATSVVSGEQSGAAASPVISREQNTPLTNNLSGKRSKQVSTPQHQNLPSSQNLVVKSSQHSPILEPVVLLKAAVNDPIAKKVEKGDLGPCHSPKLSPENLDENFAAANEVGVVNHSNPESPSADSEMCVRFDKPVGYPEASNHSHEKYSLAEAWKIDALVTSHSKFSGRSTSTHMFLNPEVHCVKCSFPQSSTFICIGNKNYINKCSNTNVWLDGNFIAGFTMLLYHYAHSFGTPLVGNEKNLPQLIHAIFSKQKLVISGVKPLPRDVDRLVAILHNDGHYIVLEVNISERKFLIYDGLSRELLQWKDNIIIVLKKCMLLDLSFDSLSTVCVPDAAFPSVVSRSRKPRYIINGYSFFFPQSSPSDKNWNRGDKRGVTSFIRWMDSTVV